MVFHAEAILTKDSYIRLIGGKSCFSQVPTSPRVDKIKLLKDKIYLAY